MRILLLLILVFAFTSAAALAQIDQPSPSPTPREDDDVVKITTSLIQLDVTVTDKKGNPISDLKRDEIEIYENGRKQDITGFNYIAGAEGRPVGAALRSMLPTGAPRPESVRRTIAIVVDDLTLSFAGTYWVKSALKKYIREKVQDGDLVAIIRTGSGIGSLQQFTTDKRQLMAAAEKIRFSSAGGGIFNGIEPVSRAPISTRSDEQREFERELEEFRESIFSAGTLGALNYVIRGMSDLPGRKSVVLLSDGLPLFFRSSSGLSQGSRILFQLRRLADLANRASVVVYTIDAKGLAAPGLTAGDNTYDMSVQQVEQALADRRQSLLNSQDGLRYIASQTGGLSIINSNDIGRGLDRVMNDQSYYLVGYEPDDAVFDPRKRQYNKLEVKVLRDGAKVRYRSGFFGVSDDARPQPKLSATQTLLTALTSPFAVNDIPLRLNSVFTADASQKSYLRSYLHLAAQNLTFAKEPDGMHKTTFDVVALTFGENGTIIDEYSQTYTVTLGDVAMKRVLSNGFVYDFALPVQKPGGRQVRVAVRDTATNKVGSAAQFVEVPNLKKGRLTLSGLVFESMSTDDWARVAANPSAYSEVQKRTDPRLDTSLRQFQRGTVMRYGFDIFNTRTKQGTHVLSKRIILFRDGKEFFTSADHDVVGSAGASGGLTNTGTVKLGPAMPVGEYILQVVVSESVGGRNVRTASQAVAFDVVE